ncbi:MAG: pilus assembly protein [Actinomycetota bacterium]|nr:pilus assembly protein [Actinomycetota bacterium]
MLSCRGCQALVVRLRLRLGAADDGRAIVEFIFVGVLLLVPLVYLVMVVGQLQAASFAVSAAAREAGRAFTTSTTEAQAAPRARAAAALPLADFGFDSGTDLQLQCDGSPCLRPEGRITVTSTVTVALPWVPDLLAGVLPTTIPVTATHVAAADRFAGR